ncbi:MAG: SigE family RNA polymerase sigma factor [Actinomycetes bacterium]
MGRPSDAAQEGGRVHESLDFTEFAGARSGPLFRTAWLLTGDWHLSEDLVQETLGRMYLHWRRVSQIEEPAAYAHTVLVRAYLSQRRRRSSHERPTAVLPDTAVRSEDEQDASLRLTLFAGLARLDRVDRAVLVLRYWEDQDVQATASLLAMTPGAVRVRCSRALDRLRRVLGDELVDLLQH